MSNSTPEAELMKNLSVQERRKLMRRMDQGSPKKSSTKPVPKPFVVGTASSGVQPAKPKSSVLNRWPNNNSNFVSGKGSPNSGNSSKSSNKGDVGIPKLNQAHVNMFTAQESAKHPELQNITKKKPPPPVKSAAVANGSNQSSKPAVNKFVSQKYSNSNTSTHSNVKSPLSHATKEPVRKTTPVVNVEAKSPVTVVKPKTPPAVERLSNNGAAVKWAPVKPVPKQTVSPPPLKQAAAKPQMPWQRPGPPLSKEKSPSPSSPPTAVVAPMQEHTKLSTPKENPPKVNSQEMGRQRAVSSPVIPPKARNDVVSYRSSSQDVMLPAITPSKPQPAVSPPQPVKTRASSEAAKHTKVPSAQHESKLSKVGHDFQPYELKEWVNWCDACGSVILSLFGKCVTCTKCNMVCHGKCALTVSLTCEADQQKARSLTLNDSSALKMYKTIVQETKDESTLKEYNTIQRVMSLEEIQQKIEDFNQTVKGSQQMTLQEDGTTFRGFIRVTMNLTRPVSVMDASKTSRKPAKKASFYIDKGAVKALHLTSDTTSAQVVQALLTKYNISDNPMKFALFEKQFREEGHVILRKMLPKERPLFLRLLWGNGSSENKGFILQENESREIHWESFSVGELQMFIKILDKEENDYITEIKRKFKNRTQDIKMAIEYRHKKG